MTDTETTPLLIDPTAGPSGGDYEQDDAPVASSTAESPALYLRLTFILTWLSIAVSVVTFAFTVAVAVIDQHAPRDYYMNWQLRESAGAMTGMSAFVAIVSFLNLVRLYHRRRAMWLLVNLIIDFIVLLYSFGYSITGLSAAFSPYRNECPLHPGNDNLNAPDYGIATCESFSRKIRILGGIGLGFGLALAIVHLAFFLLRFVLVDRWIFQRGTDSDGTNRTWRFFPTGQFTIEFTIKSLRQDNVAGSGLREGQ